MQYCNLGTVFEFNIINIRLVEIINKIIFNKWKWYELFWHYLKSCRISEAVSKIVMHVLPWCPWVLLLRCYSLFLLSGISDHKSYSYMCIHLDLRVSSINYLVLNISRTDRCYTSIVGNVGESNYQSLIHDSTHMYSTISLKDLNERRPKDRKKCFPCKL